MSEVPSLWTANNISAAGTALSALIAAGIFGYDRISAWSRRTADASRLAKLIAGDLGIELAKLRALSQHINSQAKDGGFASGCDYLASVTESEGGLQHFLRQFDTGRLDRICETTNVFDASMSDRLSTIITLKLGTSLSLEILGSIEPDDGRGDAATECCKQLNMLQILMIDVFNSVIASRGTKAFQVACPISFSHQHV